MSAEGLPPWASRQGAVILAMLEAVETAVRDGKPADRALHGLLAGKKKYGSRDRRIISDAVFCWFRWHGAVGELPLPQGLCAAWGLQGAEWPAALQAILEDLGWAPIDTQDLEGLSDRKELIETTWSISLAPEAQWLPEWWFAETAHLGEASTRLEEHLNRPPTWLRIDRELQPNLHQALMEDGAEWAGEACPCAYAFSQPGKIRTWCDQYPKGIEVQDLSSQQVARVCAPAPGATWWDACAGSGGKSLHLLDLAERKLDLTATDKRESAIENLVKRSRAHGLGKIRHYALDLTSKDLVLPNLTFDGILVDAPCSGSGTWARNPDAAWRTEEKDVRQAQRRQTQMLENLAKAVSPGKTLVYAVCSLTKSETLDVVEAFLAGHPEFGLEPFAHPLSGDQTDGTLTLLPSETHADGMFVARFVRTS